jgi:hypothetical protein
MSALFLANLVSPFALSRIQTVITFTVPLFGLRFQPATKLLHGRFFGDCIQSGRSSFCLYRPIKAIPNSRLACSAKLQLRTLSSGTGSLLFSSSID